MGNKIDWTEEKLQYLRGFIENPEDEDEEYDNEELLDFTDFFDVISVMVCTRWTMKKRQWEDYEKRLDYMEDMVERIA